MTTEWLLKSFTYRQAMVQKPTCGIEAVVCGYVETDSNGNFDLNTFTYGQSLSDSRLSDNDNWHSDWGMVMTIPDGVDYSNFDWDDPKNWRQ